MLILFKPWSSPSDLIDGTDAINIELALKTAFDTMVASSPSTLRYLNNMQALHECKDSRDDHFQSRQQHRKSGTSARHSDRDDVADDFVFGNPDEIGNEILEHLNDTESSRSNAIDSSLSDAMACVCAAESGGMFETDEQWSMDTEADSGHHIETEDHALEEIWANEYEMRKADWRSSLIDFHPRVQNLSNNVLPQISVRQTQMTEDIEISDSSRGKGPPCVHIAPPLEHEGCEITGSEAAERGSIIKEFTLNEEQTRAFSMIAEHSCTEKPSQLRMFLGGPGGTGKSQVINALHTFFQQKGQDRCFCLASFTGVAAHNIKGTTLHAALGLNQQRKGSSSKVAQELIAMWRGVDYLFIDEVSMIGCKFLLKIHQALCTARENKNPFGGINIIFAGDFAQLLPVGDTRFCSKLNTRKRATNGGQNEMFGKLLWLSVDKCVMLTEVMRQRGPENQNFVELLQRLRTGQCDEADYELLNSKLLHNARPDWSKKEWTESPVIVSNNEAKDLINL